MQVEEPPQLIRANPTLRMKNEVEGILRQAHHNREGPLSYAEIERRMLAARVDFYALKACVEDLTRTHVAYAGSKGVMFLADAGTTRSVPLE